MKTLLSHHEIATLFVLYSSPERVTLVSPDALNLQQAHLVEVVSAKSDDAQLRVTSEGAEVLRRLGLATRKIGSVQASSDGHIEPSGHSAGRRTDPRSGWMVRHH